MPKAIKKRAKTKKTEPEVEIKDRLSEIKGRLGKRQKSILQYGLGAVIIVVVVAGVLLFNYSEGRKSKELAYEAYKIYYNEYQKTPLQPQERYQKALDLFKQAYDKKKSPRLLLYIASCYKELGKKDEALTTLNDFTRQYPSDRELLPLVYRQMSLVQLEKGNKDEALKILDMLYKSDTIYKDYALMESGRILESEGKKTEADAKYKELVDKFKDSPYAEEAGTKLAGQQKEG